MPELTPSGAVDVVERQVRRVRRRKNLYELQHTVYLAIAAAGVAATILLPLALFANAATFGVAAWGTLAALGVVLLVLARNGTQRWLARAAAVAWIERQAGLRGRVRTLLELGREPALAAGFFHPLLVAEVDATLATWAPRRLVPRRVPRGALAAALGILLALATLVRLAASVAPAAPAAGSDQRSGAPRDARAARAPATEGGDRVIMAPGGLPARTESRLARLSSALQENVREQVWGQAWERVRDARARAVTSGGARLEDDEATDDAAIDAEASDDPRLARHERHRDKRHGAADAAGESADERSGDGGTATARPEIADPSQDRGDAAGGSAGNATSPDDLFSGSRVDTADTNASFELSLAARMRADEAGRRQAGGTAPDADPDAHPALAADQRREAAAHRMTIPAAYEQVVREVFAHREQP